MERVRVSAETAVQIIKNGGMLILTDDETRENEGDLVVASEFITAEIRQRFNLCKPASRKM